MGYDLSQYLVIGISSRALFDLTHENEIFEKQGLEAYQQYQLEHEDDVLLPGAGFPVVQAILRLNTLIPDQRKVEVIIMSRNSAESSLRIFNSIRHYDLDIVRAALTSGQPLSPYLNAFDVDLFLSADEAEVQSAVNAGVAAAYIYPAPPHFKPATDQLRIAFDGDAVLFSDDSERIFKEQGIDAFHDHEEKHAREQLGEGPFAKLLKIISLLQSEGGDPSPIRTALVTARSSPAHERVIRTLRSWDVRIDEAFFMGGASKAEVLKAFGAHIFFDDQDVHLGPASQYVPSAKIPYVVKAGQEPLKEALAKQSEAPVEDESGD